MDSGQVSPYKREQHSNLKYLATSEIDWAILANKLQRGKIDWSTFSIRMSSLLVGSLLITVRADGMLRVEDVEHHLI